MSRVLRERWASLPLFNLSLNEFLILNYRLLALRFFISRISRLLVDLVIPLIHIGNVSFCLTVSLTTFRSNLIIEEMAHLLVPSLVSKLYILVLPLSNIILFYALFDIIFLCFYLQVAVANEYLISHAVHYLFYTVLPMIFLILPLLFLFLLRSHDCLDCFGVFGLLLVDFILSLLLFLFVLLDHLESSRALICSPLRLHIIFCSNVLL